MSQITDPGVNILRPAKTPTDFGGLGNVGNLGNMGDMGGLTIAHEPSTAAKMDSIVAQTRLKTSPAVAEQRRVPRKSVAELNDMDLDELRERFVNTHVDGRGPMETVLDWLDAPRNLIMSTLAPGLRRRAESRGDKGTFGLGRVHASDVLEELGVSSPIARGILGFVGDVALDPLTYVGAPAKGLELTASTAKGARSVYSFTRPGRAALLSDIEHVASGAKGKSAFAPYLEKVAKEQGIRLGETGAKEALSSHVLGSLDNPTIKQAVGAAVEGKPFEALRQTWGGTVGKIERGLGVGEHAYTGSMLARDIERGDEVGDAARAALKQYGEYISEPGIRLGVKRGEAATRLFHIPFTSQSLMVPALIKANGQAQKIAWMANASRDGIMDLARVHPEAAQILAAHKGTIDDTIALADLAEEKIAANAAADAEIQRLRNEPPPPPPSATAPIAPRGPTPGGAPAAPRSPEEIAASLRQQSQLRQIQDERGIVPTSPSASPEGAASVPQSTDGTQQGVQNGIGVAGAQGAASIPTPPKSRAALIQELHSTFANVPEQARNDAVSLLDAFMRTHNVKPEEYGKYIQGFTVGADKKIKPLFQADTLHGTPHVFEPVATLEYEIDGKTDRFDVPLSATVEDESLADDIAAGKLRITKVHKYGKFDSRKMGTGEGAQAFGWGHYSAEMEEVARGYRKIRRGAVLDGNPINIDVLRTMFMDAMSGNPANKMLVDDVMRDIIYESPEYALDRFKSRSKDRMLLDWYHTLGEQYPDLLDVFEKRMNTLDEGERLSTKLLDIVFGSETTGNDSLDAALRAAIKIGPDQRQYIGVDAVQNILEGLESAPSKSGTRLQPAGGIRELRKMTADEQYGLWDIESRLSWVGGKTWQDKINRVRSDLNKTVEAQEGWIRSYAKDARVLSKPEAETVVRIVNESIVRAAHDIGIVKPENILGRVMRELDDYVDKGHIADGSVSAETIERIIRNDLGHPLADTMVTTPQWDEVRNWLYPPSQNNRIKESERIIAEAKRSLGVLDKYNLQVTERRAAGALYKTRVLADDDELLHWDKTIGEQPPKVRNILRQLIPPSASLSGMLDDVRGRDAYRYLASTTLDANTPPSQKAASQLLDSMGVKGVKYLDGMSRADGVGSHNYVIFNDDNIKITGALFQKDKKFNRAAISFDDDGAAFIHNLQQANESSLPHEMAHGFRRWLEKLNPEELAKVEAYYGIVDRTKGRNGWTRKLEERYAKDFENYLAHGIAPTEELRGVFERFKQWMLDIYSRIVGTPIEKKIPEQMRAHFHRILGGVDDTIDLQALRSAKPALREGQIIGSKTGIAKRLADMMPADDDTIISSWINQAKSESMAGFGSDDVVSESVDDFSTAFSGEIPPEVREWVSALPKEEADIRKAIVGNTNTATSRSGAGKRLYKGRGDDSFALLGEKWFDAVAMRYGSPAMRANVYLKYAQPSPERDFYEHLLTNFPKGRASREAVDLHDLPAGTAFTFNGQPMVVVDGDQGRMIRYAGGDDVPADSIGRFAVDAKSIRQLAPEEASQLAEQINPEPTAKFGAMLGGAGAEPDDLPFSPGDPLFQSDIPNQGGLFGQGNVGPSGERQGGLFGDMSKPTEQAPANPLDRREGESLEDWKIRVKFAQAEKNTGMLFQEDDLFDDDPITAVEKAREEQNAIIDEQIAMTLAAAKAKAEIARGVLSNMDPIKYGQTPASLATALALSRQYDQSVLAANRAQAVADTLETFRATLPNLAGRDKETVLRELQPLGKEIANKVYELGQKDPEIVGKLAEAAQRSVESVNDLVEIHKGQFSTWASSTDLGLRAYAQAVLGIDNVASAPSVFARVAQIAKHWGTDDQSPLVSTLEKMDEWARRTFNTHGGYKVRAVADMSAHARAGQRVAENHARHEITTAVKQVLSSHGLTEHTDKAMPILYALMHRIVDPGQSAYNWMRKTHDGPQGMSTLAQVIDDAGRSGVFAKAFPDLEKLAQQAVDKIRGMGDEEVVSDIIDSLMSNYVPITASSDAKSLMLSQKNAFPEASIGKRSGTGTPPFTLRRTTHQRYFKDELDPDGKWHWYYGFDEWLMDHRAGFYHSDGNLKTAQEIASERQIPVAKAEAYLESLAAQERWAGLVEADPTAELRYPWKPTDAYELNELYHNDRLGSLVGGSKDPEDLFDTRMDFVVGARDGMHQRAVANKKLADLVGKEMFLFADQSVISNAAQKAGEERRLANGIVVKALGMSKSSLGRDVPYFSIGAERYRMIDPGVREGFLGRLLPDTVSRGIVPVDIADHIEKAAQMSRPENLWPIIRTADELVGLWKKTTLFSPSWTVNDTIGNLFLAVSGGARVRDLAKHAPDMLALRKAIYSPEKAAAMTFKLADGRTITGDHLLNVMKERRIIENTLPAEVAAQYALENPTILSKPSKYLDKLFVPNLRLNMFTQDWMRMNAFMSHLEQGNDLDTAVFKTMQSMMDWGDFTRVETQVFRRLLPFYSWLRNNLGYQAHLLVTDPKWAASVPKLHQAIEEMLAGDALVPQDERPGWMRESLATQLTQDPSKRIGLMFAEALPTADLYHFMLPLVGTEGAMKFANALGTSVTPAIGIPYQISAGKEFFSGRSIGPDKYSADLSLGEFLRDQVRPLGESAKIAQAFGRSGTEGVARSLVGGRVQAMDDARLTSTLDRQDRETESKLRGAIARATRRGDEDTQLEATARLLRLYEKRKERGLDIPNWADQRLAAMSPVAA